MDTTLPLPAADDDAGSDWIIRLEGVTKRFPGVVANQDVRLYVRRGSFHAVIGENGAGKSTLLNILYGRYRPDDGRMFIGEEDVTDALNSPADAIRRSLALVSQHYALISALTILENMMLGAEDSGYGGLLQPRKSEARIRELSASLGLSGLDLRQRADRLSIAQQQKVEILKALYRGASILLLDEPTAALAPQEADALFELLHNLTSNGATVVFVTHKLRDVMSHSDAVTVMRAGRSVASLPTSQTTATELQHLMFGPLSAGSAAQSMRAPDQETNAAPSILQQMDSDAGFPHAVLKPDSAPGTGSVLRVESMTVRSSRRGIAVRDASLTVNRGEILGVAGVDGSGQRELAEAIVGLRRVETGRILLADADITHLDVRSRTGRGIAYIPEDRHRAGMVMDFTVSENYLLGHESQAAWGGGVVIRPAVMQQRASEMLARYHVRSSSRGPATPGRALSGGNQQKVVIARAIDSAPRLLVAGQPTRGLDASATRFVYDTLRRARRDGMGVLLFSLDLDELFELSDRIAVMFEGRIVGILARDIATPDRVGALMIGSGEHRLPASDRQNSADPSEIAIPQPHETSGSTDE